MSSRVRSSRGPSSSIRRRPLDRGAPGAPPGTLRPIHDAKPSTIVMRTFGPDSLEEYEIGESGLPAHDSQHGCVWLDVTGFASTAKLEDIARAFGLHELSIEDVLDHSQRAKVEHYESYTFIVLKTLHMNGRVELGQICVVLGDHFVITFQESEHPALVPIRERLEHARGKIRCRDASYLAYAIIDSVIDHYFPVVEAFDDQLESAEDAVFEAQDVDPIDMARRARQDLQTIRHAVWPARDAVTSLLRDDDARLGDETRIHLRDCYDHLVQLQDMIESSREIAASLLEAYLSRVSQRTNDVMKVLTIITTIFIPPTFIAGIYGMNFNPEASRWNMPEVNWQLGYPFALLLIVLTSMGSLVYFLRKGWFSR